MASSHAGVVSSVLYGRGLNGSFSRLAEVLRIHVDPLRSDQRGKTNLGRMHCYASMHTSKLATEVVFPRCLGFGQNARGL